MPEINNDEHENLSTDDQVARITLKVIDLNLNELFVRMKRSTQLKKLMNAYCDRQPFDFSYYSFLYNGRGLQGDRTPDELEMEEGDIIYVMFLTRPLGVYMDQSKAKAIVREEELIRDEEAIAREEELTYAAKDGRGGST